MMEVQDISERRWKRQENEMLNIMKEKLKDSLQQAPQFPELVGDRRLLRFLRGNRHDVDRAIQSYKAMLVFRKENHIDAIRQNIVEKDMKHPKDFPFGKLILKHFPLIIDNPNLYDRMGNPISIEQFSFSPQKVLEEVSLDEFITFHMYCCELRILVLEKMSDAREKITKKAYASRMAAPVGGDLADEEEEEEGWGVVMRGTIIRDLNGFGLEHAGQQGREIMRRIMGVTTANYPEMMHACIIVNSPWVFFTMWRFLRPLLSEHSAKKVQVLDYNYLSNLKEHVDDSQIPTFLGGGLEVTLMDKTHMQIPSFVEYGTTQEPSPPPPPATESQTRETSRSFAESSDTDTESISNRRRSGSDLSKHAQEELNKSEDSDTVKKKKIRSFFIRRSNNQDFEAGGSRSRKLFKRMMRGTGGILNSVKGITNTQSSAVPSNVQPENEDPPELGMKQSVESMRGEGETISMTLEDMMSALDLTYALKMEREGSIEHALPEDALGEAKDHLPDLTRSMSEPIPQGGKKQRMSPPVIPKMKKVESEVKAPDWVPNSEREACLHCLKPFSLLVRRHHCRMCGEIVCSSCSPHRVNLQVNVAEKNPDSLYKRITKSRSSRVCTDCFISLSKVRISHPDPSQIPQIAHSMIMCENTSSAVSDTDDSDLEEERGNRHHLTEGWTTAALERLGYDVSATADQSKPSEACQDQIWLYQAQDYTGITVLILSYLAEVLKGCIAWYLPHLILGFWELGLGIICFGIRMLSETFKSWWLLIQFYTDVDLPWRIQLWSLTISPNAPMMLRQCILCILPFYREFKRMSPSITLWSAQRYISVVPFSTALFLFFVFRI